MMWLLNDDGTYSNPSANVIGIFTIMMLAKIHVIETLQSFLT